MTRKVKREPRGLRATQLYIKQKQDESAGKALVGESPTRAFVLCALAELSEAQHGACLGEYY